MKKIFLILLLTSCSMYKTSKEQYSSRVNSQLKTAVDSQSHSTLQQVNLLEQYWKQDSGQYQALVLTKGPYRLNPDSGISGSDASIWLSGSWQRQQLMHKAADSSRSTQQQQLRLHSKQGLQRSGQSAVKSGKWTMNYTWIILVAVLAAFGWLLWRRFIAR